MVIEVLTYNIHKGFSSLNMDFTLHQLRDAVRSLGSDIVFLQEVIGFHSDHASRVEVWPEEPQFEYLADQIWNHYAYAKNAIYEQGHHGNAILSKFPITWWEQQDISTNRVEQRGLLHCAIEIPGTPKRSIHCVCIHLSLFGTGRRKQLEIICDRIQKTVRPDEPLIVAGDTNDWMDITTDLFKTRLGLEEAFLAKEGKLAKSFPSLFPMMKLDRIYFKGFKVLETQVLSFRPWKTLSDHAALRSKLEIL